MSSPAPASSPRAGRAVRSSTRRPTPACRRCSRSSWRIAAAASPRSARRSSRSPSAPPAAPRRRQGMRDEEIVAAKASFEPPLETFGLARTLVAEALGTALLLAIVIGSGIMGERLAGGNLAIALLANTLATGAGLTVLIIIFGPLSDAHFNPAVTLVFALRR